MSAAPLSPVAPRRRWLLPLAVALASLWPLLHNWTAFHGLFYFEDEWDLIDQWDKIGFGPWCMTAFAENFVPLFKSLWGGAIVLFDGNYFALVVLVWLTHAANVFLLVRISRRLGAGAAGAALAGLIFGLAWINYETLAWTVQWSAVLSLSFFLLGVDAVAAWSECTIAPDWHRAFVLGGCALASALCFSRGVLTGFSLAAWLLFAGTPGSDWPKRIGFALVPIVPAIAVAAWIFGHASGNQHHLADAFHHLSMWALYYFAQSPLRPFFSNDTPALGIILALALVKSALFAAGLALAPRHARPTLLVLLAFELGNALLLGFGRYHTGLGASGSSRYQYGALATLLPFVAILFARGVSLLGRRQFLRFLTVTGAIAVVTFLVQRPWGDTMAGWIQWRGADVRAVLFGHPPAPTPEHLSRLPWMSNDRARFLVSKYHLH